MVRWVKNTLRTVQFENLVLAVERKHFNFRCSFSWQSLFFDDKHAWPASRSTQTSWTILFENSFIYYFFKKRNCFYLIVNSHDHGLFFNKSRKGIFYLTSISVKQSFQSSSVSYKYRQDYKAFKYHSYQGYEDTWLHWFVYKGVNWRVSFSWGQ